MLAGLGLLRDKPCKCMEKARYYFILEGQEFRLEFKVARRFSVLVRSLECA